MCRVSFVNGNIFDTIQAGGTVMRTKRLGDMLVEMNLLSEEQLQDALKVQRAEKERLGTTLVTHGYIT